MIDARSLLEQFLGPKAGGSGNLGESLSGMAGSARRQFEASGLNSFGGGAALGGVLGMLLGGNRLGRMGGGGLGMGGAALLGALAIRAFKSYQQGQAAQAKAAPTREELASIPAASMPHASPAADGGALELALMRAMIGAARADGHINAEEQQRIFGQIERLDLDAEEKACVLDMLNAPVNVAEIAAAAANDEQRGEIYLAAKLAIDPDHPAERAYLESLASALRLTPALRQHLDGELSALQQA